MNVEYVIVRLKQSGIQVHSVLNDGEIRVFCPFCPQRGRTPDQEGALGINVRRNVGHCFRCGWRSRRALQACGAEGAGIVESTPKEQAKGTVKLPSDFELLCDPSDDPWSARAVSYLIKRGVSYEQIRKHRIGLVMRGRFQGRVVFPIYSNGKLVGFTGRTLLKQVQPAWLHSVGLHGLYTAARSVRSEAVLVEGVFDALRVARFLGREVDVYAMLGTNLSDDKRAVLVQYNYVNLWLDPDKAGVDATMKIGCRLHAEGVSVSITRSPTDPSELSREEILKAIDQRVTFNESAAVALRLDFLING